ncbi:hypothetical protein [Dactylosporangium sp. NPDC051541]|uniref:hypothetical protein n=1 Tax=Dactylosporangium sp. NPDC051541 TaxID=3363977 RepID=UPI00379FA655
MATIGLAVLTGCSSAGQPAAESVPSTTAGLPSPASPADAPAPSTGTTTTAAPEPSRTTTASAANPTTTAPAPGTTTAPARSAVDPCPVSVATLLEALRASADFYQRAARPAALRDASCASGYAVASTVFDGQHQTTEIVFGFDATAPRWRPLNLGSADICVGFVPGDAAAKLAACQ